MKALTVLQPFAHLISLPASHPACKRVENRTWKTNYRGLIAIHAGVSRVRIAPEPPPAKPYGIPADSMTFGAIIAVANLTDCVKLDSRWFSQHAERPGVKNHAQGPWLWILDDVVKIRPIYCRGYQGLWELSSDRENEVMIEKLLTP